MKFRSLRKKLITRVSVIFTLSFVCVLTIVAWMNAQDSESNLSQSETNIRDALVAKGKTLAANNSQALKGMVEDNAFSAVAELVSSTVKDDSDIVYGIFMDADLMPWVDASEDNPEGNVAPGSELDDETSLWASGLEQADYKTLQFNGDTVFEFAAPVEVDEEILGVIRYGLSTRSMEKLLAEASSSSTDAFTRTMTILGVVGVIAVLFGFVSTRRIAANITTPLNSLKDTAETIAGGDYSSEVNVHTDDEIGLLADNFETMRSTIRKKMADLAKLNSTGEVLASLHNQTTALEQVLQAMHEQIGVSNGSVYLMNSDDELEIKGYYPPRTIEENADTMKFKVGDGILGKAAQSKEVIYVEDTSKDSNFVDSNIHEDNNSKSLLCIPLLDKDILIGVMNCSGEIGDVHFEDADKEFTQAIARQLVITIKNIRMREVIEEQNRTLEHKVEERTAELAQKTNDIEKMLANMHQGLFTVMDNGLVHHEYAKYLEQILESNQIANRNVMDLLFSNSDIGSDQLDQIKVATDAIIGEDEMMFDFNSHLLVTEYRKNFEADQESKVIELDWDPIVMDGTIEKLMVTVRDVTALKALQGQAEEQKQELEIIGQILAISEDKFSDFIESSNKFMSECEQLIKSTDSKDLDIVASLFRNMHTVKGNARTYGFSYMTDIVHEVENTYDELRKIGDKPWDSKQLTLELKEAKLQLEKYAVIAKEKLGRGNESTNSTKLPAEKVDNILGQLSSYESESIPNNMKPLFGDLFELFISQQAMPMSSVIKDVTESIKSIVKQLDKEEPRVAVTDGGLFIKSDYCAMLNNVFMHIVRNAVDHGIESGEERVTHGKSKQGNISVTVERKEDFVSVCITDDGRGLALEKIRNKALEANSYSKAELSDDAFVANLIFSSGFSTAEEVTDVSGRGVGMDAVKRFLEENGGGIQIQLNNKSSQPGFKCFSTYINLPTSFVVENKLAGYVIQSDVEEV